MRKNGHHVKLLAFTVKVKEVTQRPIANMIENKCHIIQ